MGYLNSDWPRARTHLLMFFITSPRGAINVNKTQFCACIDGVNFAVQTVARLLLRDLFPGNIDSKMCTVHQFQIVWFW